LDWDVEDDGHYDYEDGSWEDDPEWAAQFAPYGEEFPGLAPATSGQVPAAEITRAVDLMGPAHVCLVQASRPADVLPLIGWQPTDAFRTALPVAAILRSWEVRFGSRLLRIGPSAELRLLVERPPRTLEAADGDRRRAAGAVRYLDGPGERARADVHLLDRPSPGG
jgi:Domain of unknown function (DUF4253)